MPKESPEPLPLRSEIERKMLHLSSAVVPVSYALGAPRIVIVAALGVALLVALSIEFLRALAPSVQARFVRVVGGLLRDAEAHRWTGATWLLLAFAGLVVFAPREIAVAGCWAVAAGDAMAAIIGRLVHQRSRAGQRKSIAGSAACFLVTLAGCATIAHLVWAESLVASASATLAERPTGGVNDNVRIAIAVPVGILLWRMVFS
jgi:dolichol kinase